MRSFRKPAYAFRPGSRTTTARRSLRGERRPLSSAVGVMCRRRGTGPSRFCTGAIRSRACGGGDKTSRPSPREPSGTAAGVLPASSAQAIYGSTRGRMAVSPDRAGRPRVRWVTRGRSDPALLKSAKTGAAVTGSMASARAAARRRRGGACAGERRPLSSAVGVMCRRRGTGLHASARAQYGRGHAAEVRPLAPPHESRPEPQLAFALPPPPSHLWIHAGPDGRFPRSCWAPARQVGDARSVRPRTP